MDFEVVKAIADQETAGAVQHQQGAWRKDRRSRLQLWRRWGPVPENYLALRSKPITLSTDGVLNQDRISVDQPVEGPPASCGRLGIRLKW